LPLPWVFYNQFIDSPVLITGKFHGNNKEKNKKKACIRPMLNVKGKTQG
jgi:hypothetical protein